MQTIEGLKRKIQTTEDLQSVVKTMKALAAVNIRQYERAANALKDYTETIERALQIILTRGLQGRTTARKAETKFTGAVVFGSDQGMAGQFNEQIAYYTQSFLKARQVETENQSAVVIGQRVQGLLEDTGMPIRSHFAVPGSLTGVTPLVQELLLEIESWREELGLINLFIFYNRHQSGARYDPVNIHLLPVDKIWLQNIASRQWPTRVLPMFTMDWDALFSSLIRQYIFSALYRAMTESLASENASRLAAMQGAERNIEERLSELNHFFHQRRQMSITEELLDIISGFEALKTEASSN